MKQLLIAVLCLAMTTTVLAASAADEARAAETAFAKAFADRDADAFFAMMTDDAVFLGPNQSLHGRAKVREGWSNFFKDAKAPFSWKPERVVANEAGNLALSTGPIYAPDGTHVANYISTWQKQADGTWKVIFDGPGAPVCPPAEKK